MDYVLGNDISAWQRDHTKPKGKVDFNKMKEAGSSFCFMRAYFGLTKDIDFDTYWPNAKAAGIMRGAYYFPLTTQSITTQTQQFIDLLKPDRGEIPPVIDIEKYKLTVPTSAAIKIAVKMIEQQLDVKPIIYTGFYVWRDDVVGSSDLFFANYDLWIATYSAKPMIPKPWTNWTFWQISDKGDGLKYGVESLNIDMDYYNGDLAQFSAYIKNEIPIPTPPPPPVTDEIVLKALTEMNVRTGPSVKSPRIGSIPEGSTVKPISFAGTSVWGNDSWAEISQGKFVCIKRGDTQYLE